MNKALCASAREHSCLHILNEYSQKPERRSLCVCIRHKYVRHRARWSAFVVIVIKALKRAGLFVSNRLCLYKTHLSGRAMKRLSKSVCETTGRVHKYGGD